jgi:BirA family biotin operon repressor/biotin-[acetyl-CoA-carboxylase] ligase
MTFVEFNKRTITTALGDLPLGGIRYYPSAGSTNDLALAWANEGATDMSLVIAGEQTSGRGRNGRKWFSPAGGCLAFSLILRPGKTEVQALGVFSGLGALAVTQTIDELQAGLYPQIKWPNDVLISQKKVCGVLAEAIWMGDLFESLVMGVGLNVSPLAVPPMETQYYPATSLEDALNFKIDRLVLLHDILKAALFWRSRLGTPEFLESWESRLAFRGEQVQIWSDHQPATSGRIKGLDAGGGLVLIDPNGQEFCVCFGEVHLRPAGL